MKTSGGSILKKSTLTIIAWVYTLLLIIGFSIYLKNNMNSNGQIDFSNRMEELYIIISAFFIGLLLHSIDGAALKNKEKKISKNTMLAGLSIAAFFLVWRLLMTIS